MYDVCIIGAGVVGAAIARELSKYDVSICLIEKEEDVALGASKANSGIVHGGYAAKHGTLKGELCLKGNKLYSELDKELNFGFRETGALVLGFSIEDEKKIRELYENGLKVGCEDLEILHGEEIRKVEPNISSEAKVALYCKSVGVASPYELVIALVENAIDNGVQLKLETEVLGIKKEHGKFNINTSNEDIQCRYVINAAGLYSDKVSEMIGVKDFSIVPRRGQYVLLGKDQGHLVKTVIFQVPTEKGKGVLVTTTYHGNLMIGPNAEETGDRNDVGTNIESLTQVISASRKSIKAFDIRKSLTTFSGIRAVSSTGDFIIGESVVKGFINAAGIDSPGLTSSPAIAEKVLQILHEVGLKLVKKSNFISYRKPVIVKKDETFNGSIDDAEPAKNIICRCEKVTEAEILDSMRRGIKVKTVDGIKRRTRAGMGPCQGNFCRERVKAIIARELNMKKEEVMQRGALEASPERVSINMIRKIDM